MAATDLQVPGWPLVTILLSADQAPEVDGKAIAVPAGEDPRSAAFAHAVAMAARLGRPVRVKLTDPDGIESVLAAHPDGSETVLTPPATGRGKKPKPPKAVKKPKPALTARPEKTSHEAGEPTPPTPQAPTDPLETALAAGDWATAAAELKNLKGTSGETDRVAELEAQLAAIRGDAVSATKQYIALALARHGTHGPNDPHTERAAALAQESWPRITDPTEARKAGTALLALRQLVPGPDPQTTGQVRTRLARLHLS